MHFEEHGNKAAKTNSSQRKTGSLLWLDRQNTHLVEAFWVIKLNLGHKVTKDVIKCSLKRNNFANFFCRFCGD